MGGEGSPNDLYNKLLACPRFKAKQLSLMRVACNSKKLINLWPSVCTLLPFFCQCSISWEFKLATYMDEKTVAGDVGVTKDRTGNLYM